MKMFTNVLKMMMITFLSLSFIIIQAQNDTFYDHAPKNQELNKEQIKTQEGFVISADEIEKKEIR